MYTELIKAFKRRNINGYYIEEKEEIFTILKELLVVGSSIGCGDSVTLEELGVFDFVRENDYIFYDKHKDGLTSQEKRELYLLNFDADVFLTGTNAITEDGKIINIDGNGSRVAPMIYGPRKVIIVVGTNKITKTEADGIKRVKNVAAPLDAERLDKNTPCRYTGKCMNCFSTDRICNSLSIIGNQFDSERIHVIIVDETVGF